MDFSAVSITFPKKIISRLFFTAAIFFRPPLPKPAERRIMQTPKMNTGVQRWAVLLVFTSAIACAPHRSIPETALEALNGADYIEVRSTNKYLKLIYVKWKIRKTAEWLRQHQSGWSVPWSGAPMPEVVFNFYRKGNKLMSFGVGHDCVTMGEGQMWSQALPEASRQDLFTLLEIEEKIPR
jgi:hypothetical protein